MSPARRTELEDLTTGVTGCSGESVNASLDTLDSIIFFPGFGCIVSSITHIRNDRKNEILTSDSRTAQVCYCFNIVTPGSPRELTNPGTTPQPRCPLPPLVPVLLHPWLRCGGQNPKKKTKKKMEVVNLLSANNTARFKHRSPPAPRVTVRRDQSPATLRILRAPEGGKKKKTEAIHAGCPVLEPGSPGERNRDMARSLVSHHTPWPPLWPPPPVPPPARSPFVRPFWPQAHEGNREGVPRPDATGHQKSLAQPWVNRSTAGMLGWEWAQYTYYHFGPSVPLLSQESDLGPPAPHCSK